MKLVSLVLALALITSAARACNQTDYDAGRCYDINHCSAQDRHKGYC